MKKYVEFSAEAIASLETGKRVEGAIRRDEKTGKLVFKHYIRQTPPRKHDTLIKVLEHGWVKESVQRVKFFSSVKKAIGTTRVISVLERETNAAKNALIDRELDFVPFP
jgi:hypothetical protein